MPENYAQKDPFVRVEADWLIKVRVIERISDRENQRFVRHSGKGVAPLNDINARRMQRLFDVMLGYDDES